MTFNQVLFALWLALGMILIDVYFIPGGMY